jgi:type IV pilus assembly protein PilA
MSEVILALSACRTSITEVYQTGGTAPGANSWGCENVTSKYVQALSTDDDGVVIATVQAISGSVDGSCVTLIPMIAAAQAAVAVGTPSNMGEGLYGWICGGTGTTVAANYLPGSCRGN